jgi:oxygen-independent coproporphyrinogen-3 oxidase
MTITTVLLQKYSQPGPRYTSYPTAPYFTETVGADAWRTELQQTCQRDLSLYVHIPFCDSLCYYCGCNMIATKNYAKATTYLTFLYQEISRVAALTQSNRVVRQIHWGGGTPTYLHPDDIRRLMAHIRSHFNIADNAEVACEIDPRELSHEHVHALVESGFNRVSLGVQDLDLSVQQAVNRVQPLALIQQVNQWMRDAGTAISW